MIKLDTCTFKACGAKVRASAMADHWITAQHYTPNLPARRLTFIGDALDILKGAR